MDIGCGLAYGTDFMAEYAADITGIDYDQDTVNENKAAYKDKLNLHFERGTVPPIQAEENTFDVITAFQFIEHIKSRVNFADDKSSKLLVATAVS